MSLILLLRVPLLDPLLPRHQVVETALQLLALGVDLGRGVLHHLYVVLQVGRPLLELPFLV